MPTGFGTLLEKKDKMMRDEKYLCKCASSLVGAVLWLK